MEEKPSDFQAIIYCIKCIPTGKEYIGQTYNYKYGRKWYSRKIEHRLNEHLNFKENCKKPLSLAIKKYGKDNFTIREIERCSEEDCSKREHYWIKTLNTIKPEGYNVQLFSRRIGASIADIGTAEFAEIKAIKEKGELKKVRVLIKYQEYESKIRHMFNEDNFENSVKRATEECLKILDHSNITFHHSLYGTQQLNPVDQYKEKLKRIEGQKIKSMRVYLFLGNTIRLYIRTESMEKYSDQLILNFGGDVKKLKDSLDRAEIIIDEYRKNDDFVVTYDDRIKYEKKI